MDQKQSSEDYLEDILVLSKKLPVVRSVDVANDLGFAKPSISVAMKKLREKNLITVTDAGFIYLTAEGKKIAEEVYERHTLFTEWLIKIGVDPEIAADDACKLEHTISKESFEAIKNILYKSN